MSNVKCQNNMRCHAIWEAWVLCHDVLVHSGVTRILHHPNGERGRRITLWCYDNVTPLYNVQCPVSTPVMSIVQCPVVIVSVAESSHGQDSAAGYEERVRFKCAPSLDSWLLSSTVVSNVLSSILHCPIKILSTEWVVHPFMAQPTGCLQ